MTTNEAIFKRQITALTGGTIIDGTGSKPKQNVTILLEGEKILEVGHRIKIPDGADTVDVSGKFIIPGLIDMHAHFFGRSGHHNGGFLFGYPRLFLAGGVTTARSPGERNPKEVFAFNDRIKLGTEVGCRIFCAGPYFDHCPSEVSWFDCINSAEEAESKFELWKDSIDFVKVYSNIQEDELIKLIELAHSNNLKVSGHLGSITARRAIELGINSLEHGIFHIPEFTKHATKDTLFEHVAAVNIEGEEMKGLLDSIITNNVAIIPTVLIFQWRHPDFQDVDAQWHRFLSTEAKEQQAELNQKTRSLNPEQASYLKIAIDKQLTVINKIYRSGGKVLCGTDPTPPQLVPGKGLHREMELFVEAGLTPLEVIKIATHDSAKELGLQNIIGSIEAGKEADLVVLDKDPLANIENLDKISAVYQKGIAYDPVALTKSVEGLLG
jgi:imidazolonepropionase-like amidohydrolase